MNYLKGNFTVHMGLSAEGRDNFDRIFGKKNEPEPPKAPEAPPVESHEIVCPGCGAKTFTASTAQMEGSFVLTSLRCVKCGDGVHLEGQVPPGSLTGRTFGVTWEGYLKDLRRRYILARQRAEDEGVILPPEDFKTIEKRIEEAIAPIRAEVEKARNGES